MIPIVTTSSSTLTSRLASYLDDLLRPIIQIHIRSTTFQNEADFIRKLNHYIDENRMKIFKTTTQFVRIQILHYQHLASYDILLPILQDFLKHSLPYSFLDGLSMKKIFHLTTLALQMNRFYYNNKIYRFLKGGPANFPLIQLLTELMITQWQKLLYDECNRRNEFFGR